MKAATLEKVTSQSLSEAVRERLLRLIARGELQPGGRLNEVHLAENFGVSRGPIREAARELEGQGYLVSRPNQGFYVVDFTPQEIRDIYEVKDWMEAAFIADLAAHTDIAARQAILADIAAIDASDRVNFTQTLFEFRLRMSAQIENRFLADLMVTLYRKFYILSVVVKTDNEPERLARIRSALSRFWTAMVEGDIEAAREVMRDDTAYWLADLPPRFNVGDAPPIRNPTRNQR